MQKLQAKIYEQEGIRNGPFIFSIGCLLGNCYFPWQAMALITHSSAKYCEAIPVFTGFSQASRLWGQPRDQVPPIAVS